jgi:D-amino-acid oxidase
MTNRKLSDLDALVIGAGVCGLTTAISLLEAGLTVAIRATGTGTETTSAAAGAIWSPYLVGPEDRVKEWGRVGIEVLIPLADDPEAGIHLASGIEASRGRAEPPPYWADLVPDFRLCDPEELPGGFTEGWRFTAPIISMPVYLRYLLTRFERAGGQLELSPVTSLAEAATAAPVTVNCTGIGARDLVPDPEVVPVRGQSVVVANPGIEEFFIDRSKNLAELTYMFPHGDTILLGGTAEEGEWDKTPKPEISERIVRGCTAIDPRLHGAEILEHRVGLRPSRPEVRLESETLDGGRVLWHNYGHGGGGVTLSWGCAREIIEATLGR